MSFGWTAAGGTRHRSCVLAFLALVAGLFTGVPSWAGTVRDIRVERGRIILTFDERVAEASSFVLNEPRRIAIDLSGATPGGSASVGGPIAGVRQAARDGGARIVLDLDTPAIVTDGHFGEDGRTLTLQLKSVDDGRFARASAEGRRTFLPDMAFATPARANGYSVTMRVPTVTKALPLPRVVGPADRPLVVIDAGHGGHDPGAISPDGSLQEKELTLKVARAIRDDLVSSGRARVALTRDDDRFLVLRERYEIARRMGAALFISIHCDSAGNPEATGATVYTLSEIASDKEAARLAARENKADVLAGVDLGDAGADISQILIDLTQRETMNTSASFARVLGREARPLMPTKATFHRMASLMVLKAPDVPSILFETGYISNQNDADFLASREGREKVAESVRRAVEVHFATRLAGRGGVDMASAEE
ncbi:N-acetylmuramoyl-L-alanine amidase [Sphingomonas sp. Leaf33]|uniref:N-acetylmuramoyl-L-alanine amidase n=1 Tax=Sphingomonas sp. Leaf33 TaxID=1736215 RepID=UPI0006FD5297|nr:N-acetylmuramoyl-L-alanine amidase [Sphingomonas sp. Leaf33]KQN25411.1 N-acetylmuramoyl-L-alanine amidase [Sphingomonas sp. Leaf33]